MTLTGQPAGPRTRDGASGDAASSDVAARLRDVRGRIARAAERAGRSPSSVVLVAVSKRQPLARVREALAAGQRDLGESRAQELVERLAELGPAPSDGPVRWHFVGRLQSNKAREVVGRVSLVHSLDRLSLAEELGRRAHDAGRIQRVLVQVNAGEDPAKAGVATADAGDLVRRIRSLDGLSLEGDPRPVFARLRALRDELREQYPELQHLSMGMSADFEVAVEEGATIVRVGEAAFGPRPARGTDRRE
jgi:pyridoxal phosphate enzyme (YggS family)